MLRFFAWRLGRGFLTILVVLMLVFVAGRIIGNPIDYLMGGETMPSAELYDAMMKKWGLDRPIPEQFVIYVRQALSGDFGDSLFELRPVVEMFRERVGATLSLGGLAFLLSLAVGMPLGIVAAIKRNSGVGRLAMTFAFLGYAVPHFIIAITLILIFSFTLHWLPSTGNATPWHYVMPAVTLAAGLTASVARYMRSAMLDAMSQDFMRTARAKGLTEFVVIFKHALRNALLPVVTVLGLQITYLVSGSIIVEKVFAWPGIGELLVGAVVIKDYPTLQFGVISYAALVVMVNLAVDVLYMVIDPRIRVEA